MEFNVAVADLVPDMEIQGYYVLRDAQVKKASNGRPYLSGQLSDATGSVDAKHWDFSGTLDAADNGRVVLIRGQVSEFRGTLQMTINRFRFANDQDKDKYDIRDLVASAPIDTDKTLNEIRGMVESMDDADYRRVCEMMLEKHLESFSTIPAAKSVHHGFRNGLLMHTASMMRTADFLAGNYSGLVDRNLLLAGTLLHDMAKEKEFVLSSLGLVTDYSVKGELLGHLVMGAQNVAETAKELGIPEEKSVLLQHMLLSHHGMPELGAAVKPKCAESELLSYLDLIDSRLEIYAEAFETTPTGEMSPRIYALEKRIYNHGKSIV